MYVIIDGIRYDENERVKYENAYGIIDGVICYGEWSQDGSGGEYTGRPCYGWYVKTIDITPFDYSTETKEELLEYYPTFESEQSLLYLLRDIMFNNFRKVESINL